MNDKNFKLSHQGGLQNEIEDREINWIAEREHFTKL